MWVNYVAFSDDQDIVNKYGRQVNTVTSLKIVKFLWNSCNTLKAYFQKQVFLRYSKPCNLIFNS